MPTDNRAVKDNSKSTSTIYKAAASVMLRYSIKMEEKQEHLKSGMAEVI